MGFIGLPEGYRLLREVDLQKNKKIALWLNLASLILAAALVLLGLQIAPASKMLFNLQAFLQLLAALLGMIAYVFLHEWMHGVCIRFYTGERAEYGFTGLYAYAGKKDAYFDRKSYIVVALAPVAVWGLVLTVLCIVFSRWFWIFYFIQVINVSGAAGDLYVTYLLMRMPKDTRVNDDGVSMRFYTHR